MKTELKTQYGIVAMIDALGIRNATIQESKDFIHGIQDIVASVPPFVSKYLEDSPKSKKIEIEPPQLTTFGDTCIFTWEMKPGELSDFLPDVGVFLSYVIILGLRNKLAFRGALSVGNYIQSGATILGPAISDAAAWYDTAEMIGVIATPQCGQLLSTTNETKRFTTMEFLKYSVPIKCNISKELWVTGWPDLLDAISHKDEPNFYKTYFSLIQHFPIPKGTEEKYFNTEKFVKWAKPPNMFLASAV
jgi:hypothetical protein